MTTFGPARARRTAAFAVLAATGLALSACSSASGGAAAVQRSGGSSSSYSAGYPVTVSSCGRDFTYAKEPSRVVLGYHGTLATLDALGVQDRVYGYLRGPDDTARPAGLPADLVEVSPDHVPAREAVIAARPDLFLSDDERQLVGQGTLSYDDLTGAGGNAYVLGAYCAQDPANRSIDTVYDDVTSLGRIFDVPAKAAAVDDRLRQQVAAAKASLHGSTATVAFLKVLGGDVYAIGGYPVAPVLGALGLKNQFADLPTPFAKLSPEEALTMKPDVVFVNYVGTDGGKAAIAELAKALPDLPALKAGHVYGADEAGPQAGGVGVVDGLRAVAADVAKATAQ